jgi:hypothetical protein
VNITGVAIIAYLLGFFFGGGFGFVMCAAFVAARHDDREDKK